MVFCNFIVLLHTGMNQSNINIHLICFLFAITLFSCKKEDDGGSQGNLPFITSMQPAAGVKGTIVTLKGANFSNDISQTGVYLNGKYADVISASTTEILFEVPAGAGSGAVSLIVKGNGITGPQFEFIYTVMVFAFSGYSLIPGNVDGSSSTARFNAPAGMAIDQNNNLYVADELNHTIRKITPVGNVSTFAGNGIAGHQDGSPNVARFNQPTDIAFDAINGYFYVSDKGNHCIRKINLAGDVFTIAGIPGVPGYVDAPGQSARFQSPAGVAVEGELVSVYITDQGNHCIRKLDDVGVVTTFAGSAVAGQQDGVGGAAKFVTPADITWDSTGYLFVTDVANHNIRRITKTSRLVTTAAGSGADGYQDGSPSQSLFSQPRAIIAENNTVIICDTYNNRIRQLIYGSGVTTLSGDGTAAYSDGIGLQAKFNKPGGIVKDKNGNYFITDTGNNTIRRMTVD